MINVQLIQRQFQPYIYLPLGLFFLLLVRSFYFYTTSDSVLVGVIPDDAFYYLQLAKNRALLGFWSFDGIAPATGFHLFFGYLLYSIYKIFGVVDWRDLFFFISILASLAISSSAYLCCSMSHRLFGPKLAFVAVAPFFCFDVIYQSTNLMESWLVIFFSSLTIYTTFNTVKLISLKAYVDLFLIGLLGSLSRSDFGMLPGATFIALTVGLLVLKDRIWWFRSLTISCGAVTGVGLITAHNFWISGNFFQASAKVKLYWSSIVDHRIQAPIDLVAQMVMPIGGGSFRVVAPLIALTLFLFLIRKNIRLAQWVRTESFYIALSTLLTICGYIAVYRHNSLGLQNWYIGNFVAPYSLLLTVLFFWAFKNKKFIACYICFIFYFCIGMTHLLKAPWPNQILPLNLSRVINNMNLNGSYAAWNAGILGFFIPKQVTNIDGLTNDEVLPFIKENQLTQYWVQRNIGFILDDEEMINSPFQRRKGGYNDPAVDNCLKLVKPENPQGLELGTIRIYQIDSICLKKDQP